MPLKKLLLKPGVNRENTRYTSEGGWYESDNIRFRQGTPEKLGGWTRISEASYLGLARSLLNWITLTSQNLVGVGTHLKFYIENGGGYNDITPLRATTSAGDVTFSAVASTLDGAINASITTITLADTSGFPAAGKIIIESEVIDYSAISSNTLTGCTRGASSLVSGTSTSTTAAIHSDTTAVGCFSVTVADSSHGASTGDFVTYSGAASLGGNIVANMLNQEYQIENVIDANNYVILAKSFSSESITNASYTNTASTSSDSGNGGGSVVGAYQINSGASSANPLVGWGAAGWGAGAWGQGEADTEALRVWSQQNFGEDLIFAHRNGAIFYWDASDAGGNLNTRAVGLTTLSGASNVPTVTNNLLVSDINRFVFCFGTNPLGVSAKDPMLIRWSDQEDATNWTPAATNQAGSLRLSRGTEIVAAQQSRQEVLVWTDSSVYSLQYVGAGSGVWSATLVGEQTSIASQNSVAYANGVSYWMGKDKFYKYDGRVQTLRCDLRKFIFTDFNDLQYVQVFGGSNEAFHEVWWFYCSGSSSSIDRYVIYNYREDIWYYGNMARTAWLDSGLRSFPLAATYNSVLVDHENGIDDNETGTPAAISAFITSAQFDLEDGHQFALVSRMIPDVSFEGSTGDSPTINMTLFPLNSSGSGRNTPASESGVNAGTVVRSASSPVDVYTEQIHTRVRGRQMSLKVDSGTTGVQWQLGSPRLDMRSDGRR
jgi:hypothetical protein